MGSRLNAYKFICRPRYEFIYYNRFVLVPVAPFSRGCDSDTKYSGYFSHPSFSFFVRAEYDDRGDVGVAIDDDSVEQTFCHGGRGAPGRE